jgi:hypothetical protein
LATTTSTWLSARSLAANLRALKDIQTADDLDRDTRARQKRVAKGIDPDRIQEHEPEDMRLSWVRIKAPAMSELETRAQNAAEKLGRIRQVITVTPDADLRPKLVSILDAQ